MPHNLNSYMQIKIVLKKLLKYMSQSKSFHCRPLKQFVIQIACDGNALQELIVAS